MGRLSLFCHFSSESSFHQKKPFNFRVKLLLLGLVETEGNPKLKSRKKKSFNWPLHCPSLKQRKRRSRSTVQGLLCFKVHPLHLRLRPSLQKNWIPNWCDISIEVIGKKKKRKRPK